MYMLPATIALLAAVAAALAAPASASPMDLRENISLGKCASGCVQVGWTPRLRDWDSVRGPFPPFPESVLPAPASEEQISKTLRLRSKIDLSRSVFGNVPETAKDCKDRNEATRAHPHSKARL